MTDKIVFLTVLLFTNTVFADLDKTQPPSGVYLPEAVANKLEKNQNFFNSNEKKYQNVGQSFKVEGYPIIDGIDKKKTQYKLKPLPEKVVVDVPSNILDKKRSKQNLLIIVGSNSPFPNSKMQPLPKREVINNFFVEKNNQVLPPAPAEPYQKEDYQKNIPTYKNFWDISPDKLIEFPKRPFNEFDQYPPM
jgi:hypothetical protein